jgi:hypothetical protein
VCNEVLTGVRPAPNSPVGIGKQIVEEPHAPEAVGSGGCWGRGGLHGLRLLGWAVPKKAGR